MNKKIWFFRFKKLPKQKKDTENIYLITNDIWKYAFLKKEEFDSFINWEITKWKKYNELVEKKFIKDKNYEKEMPICYAKKNNFLAHWPSLHIIVITLRCNHKCQYCHATATSTTTKEMDMSIETAKKVVDTIFYSSNPNLTIEFQWWEPILNWEVVKYIVEYAKIKASHLSKNISFALVTNLTLMDDEKLDFIIKNNIHISTSLDWDEEVHNINRTFKNKNSFKEVTKWIKKINAKYKKEKINKKVWALVTVTKYTLTKYRELVDTYVSLWLDSVFLRPINPYGFAAGDLKKLTYPYEEFAKFYKKSMDYIISLNKKWVFFRENLSMIFLQKILTDGDPNYLDERSPCWACIWQVAYNYDWKIYSCDEGRMLWRMWDDSFLMTCVSDSWEETYKNMIESETTKVMVQASTLDGLPGYNDSAYKPYIWVCPIYNYKIWWNIISNYSKNDKKKLDYAVLDYIFDKLRSSEDEKIFKKWIGMK